jgi:hypothetical protein
MKIMATYKPGQWLHISNGKEECIGVISDAGSERSEQLCFTGVTKDGYNKSVHAEYLYKWDVMDLSDKLTDR